MRFSKVGAALFAAGLLWNGAASAEQITATAIITGLQGPVTTVVVDPNALIAEVNANVGKGVANLPAWSQLANLTQLIVDIEFEFDSKTDDALLMTKQSLRFLLHELLERRREFQVDSRDDYFVGCVLIAHNHSLLTGFDRN